MMADFEALYMEVRSLALQKGMTVPVVFKALRGLFAPPGFPENWWATCRSREGRGFRDAVGKGRSPEETLEELKMRLEDS